MKGTAWQLEAIPATTLLWNWSTGFAGGFLGFILYNLPLNTAALRRDGNHIPLHRVICVDISPVVLAGLLSFKGNELAMPASVGRRVLNCTGKYGKIMDKI